VPEQATDTTTTTAAPAPTTVPARSVAAVPDHVAEAAELVDQIEFVTPAALSIGEDGSLMAGRDLWADFREQIVADRGIFEAVRDLVATRQQERAERDRERQRQETLEQIAAERAYGSPGGYGRIADLEGEIVAAVRQRRKERKRASGS